MEINQQNNNQNISKIKSEDKNELPSNKSKIDNQHIPNIESEDKNELPSNKSKTDSQNISKIKSEDKNEIPSNKSKTDSQNTPKTKTSSSKKDSFKTKRPNENKKSTFNNIQQSSQKKYLKTIALTSISFIIIISSILLVHFYNPFKSQIKQEDSLEHPYFPTNKQKSNENKIPGEENDMTNGKNKINHWTN